MTSKLKMIDTKSNEWIIQSNQDITDGWYQPIFGDEMHIETIQINAVIILYFCLEFGSQCSTDETKAVQV